MSAHGPDAHPTVATRPVAAGGPDDGATVSGGLPFARILAVELRKIVDTRSGRWTLASIGLLTVAALAATISFGEPDVLRFPMLVAVTSTVLTLLFPVLGILTVTGEFAHRTALTTFAVEPRRTRVVAAKALAATGWAAVGLVVAVALGAAAHAIAAATRHVPLHWTPDLASLGGFAVVLTLAVWQGIGFGLVLRQSALAIVTYFVLPTAWAFVMALVPSLAKVAPWADPAVSGDVLVRGAAQASDWAHVAVANGIWVALPLVVGTVLLNRRDVS